MEEETLGIETRVEQDNLIKTRTVSQTQTLSKESLLRRKDSCERIIAKQQELLDGINQDLDTISENA